MIWTGKITVIAALAALGSVGVAPAGAQPAGSPTCSETLGIEVHGQHIVGDYVTGLGHEELDWPPDEFEIGEIVGANGGPAVRGGPGPGFHFPNGFAPGASFCTESRSPGTHL